jgi:site-specific DNA recombinase
VKIKKTMVAVGYVRVSTDDQSAEGQSLDSQAAKIESYAKSQGWNLIEIYREEGYSGKTTDRPELNRLIMAVRNAKIDVLLVYRVDRLTRRQKDLWTLLEDVLEPNRVGFKSVSEPFDTTTATGKAFLSMLGTFAQLERDTIAERTADTLRHKKNNGEWVGRVPFGYRIGASGRLEKDGDQQKAIARIRRYRKRGLSFRDIAKRMAIPRSTVSDLINNNGRNRLYTNRKKE